VIIPQEGVKCCRKHGFACRIAFFATEAVDLPAEELKKPQILLIVPQNELFLTQRGDILRRKDVDDQQSMFFQK
jgi:hypothetical protein